MQPFKKSLIALVILAVLLGIWAIVNRKDADYTPPPRDVVFSALRAAISPSDVGRITVTGDKDKEMVVARKDGEWALPALHDYPADKKFVDELILDLMKLGEERLEARTAASHADYEVDAEKGKKIALADARGKDLWALVVGKSVSGSMNRGFVRLDGKDEVYSVAPALSWKLKTYGDNWSRNWLNSTLVEFNKDKGEDVAKIEVIRADGERFTVEKVEEEKPIEEPGGDKDDAGGQMPKTVKETKWYVVAANGERFEADSSARSGFTSQFDRFTGTDPVKPAPLADYGLEPAYLTLKVTTSFTKEEFKSEKPRTYEILVGAQVPEEEKKDEAPPGPAAPETEASPEPAVPETGAAPEPPAPDVDPAPAAPTSTESGGSSAIQDAAEPPPPPPEPAATPAAPPVAEPPPPALPATELPAEAPPQAPAGEVFQPEAPAEAPAAAPAPAEPPAPKFKTDRYVTVRGDRRIMTIAEWKLKSIDKKAEDFKPKKEEPKQEEPAPAEAGPPEPAEAGPPAPAEATPPAPVDPPPPPPPAEKPAAVKYGARHILIAYQGSTRDAAVTRTKEDAQKKAGELLAELQKDAGKFAELAKQWSDCPSKNDGGDLGTFGEGQMVPAFESAVKELTVGDLSGVVETQYGFHILERTK